MKNKVLVLSVVLTLAAHSGITGEQDTPQKTAFPEATGVYYQNSSGFVALRAAPPVQAKGKGGWSVFTPARVKMQFSGTMSGTRINEKRPTFYVNQVGWDERTCTLLRLVPGKGTRDLPMAIRRGAAKEKFIIPVSTKVLGMNPGPPQYPTFTVTPLEELKPGEYLIAFNPSGSQAYEFGITKEAPSPGASD